MMFDFLIQVSSWSLPVFVFATMLNVGLTQKLSNILEYYKDWKFYGRMLFANFILAPAVMLLILNLGNAESYITTTLLIFSLAAGAPFLIKLTQNSGHDLALGASLMLLLIVGTAMVLPIMLPELIPGLAVNTSELAWSLTEKLILPIAGGLILVYLFPRFTDSTQPLVAKTANVALVILLLSTMVGYFPQAADIVGEGGLWMGALFVITMFFVGYFLGGKYGEDNLEDVGALGTAQRNTAASMIVAAQNFPDQPDIFILVTIVNVIGLLFLLSASKILSKNNAIEIVEKKSKMDAA